MSSPGSLLRDRFGDRVRDGVDHGVDHGVDTAKDVMQDSLVAHVFQSVEPSRASRWRRAKTNRPSPSGSGARFLRARDECARDDASDDARDDARVLQCASTRRIRPQAAPVNNGIKLVAAAGLRLFPPSGDRVAAILRRAAPPSATVPRLARGEQRWRRRRS